MNFQKFTHKILAPAALTICAGTAMAQATTIKFEDAVLTAGFLGGETFSEADYTFTVIDPMGAGLGLAGSGQMAADCGPSLTCPVNNTSQFYAAFNDGALKIEQTAGILFSLNSFDASFVTPTPQSLSGVSFARLLMAGVSNGQTMYASFDLPGLDASKNLNFSNFNQFGAFGGYAFSSLTISSCVLDTLGGCLADSGNAAQFALDNLQITAVPEPTSLALMGLGLLGLVAVSRRRAK